MSQNRSPRFAYKRWLVEGVGLLAWLAAFLASVFTILDEPFGWVLIVGLSAIPPIYVLAKTIRYLRHRLAWIYTLERSVNEIREVLVGAKNSGRYRCNPSAVDAWKATFFLRENGTRTFRIKETKPDVRRLVVIKGKSDGLVSGLRVGIYDTREGTLILPLNLKEGIEEHETYIDFGQDDRIAERIIRHEPSTLEVRLLDPAESETGAGEVEQLLGRLLFKLDPLALLKNSTTLLSRAQK